MTDKRKRFEAEVLPHLDAAYNLARWLVRDEQVAEDIVQDAFLRAFQYFGGFRQGPARPWLLAIVRNVCHNWFAQRKRSLELIDPEPDPELDGPSLDAHGHPDTPETLLAQTHERAQVNAAIAGLPVVFREALVLREIEEMSYDDIAHVLAIPVGTVMSRLSRARAVLRKTLTHARPF
jgi:RNA polymerase sigma factor (sigma-70 family)